jgi:hypothetical protein
MYKMPSYITACKIIAIILIFISVLVIYVFMQNKNQQIQLVIARYNEDLEWLKEECFAKYPVICYNKGPNENFYKPKNMKVVHLENVGRCDHTYLYHIITNYDNLSKHTLFLPGSCNMDFKIFKAKRWLHEIEKTGKGVFIGVECKESILKRWYHFSINEWTASFENNRNLNPETKLYKSNIRPFGNWYQKHFGDLNVYYYTCGGIMGIQKSWIIQDPRSYYEKFILELNKSSNPEVGHYIERAWVAIFHPMKNCIFIAQ